MPARLLAEIGEPTQIIINHADEIVAALEHTERPCFVS